MKRYFEGYYFKQQSAGYTLALIPGVSDEGAFVQVITDTGSYNVRYPRREYRLDRRIRVGENVVSRDGVELNIKSAGIRLAGKLEYAGLTPIESDIMGPFRFFSMECRHGIISMRHTVNGSVTLNGERIDFNKGRGYIESDSGRSFPKEYVWVQCNDFERSCSIMASAARIPFAGVHFWGCICIVWLDGREYRIATYRGAKIRRSGKGVLERTQGKFRLEVYAEVRPGHALLAPQAGSMSRTIHESASCPARFRFSENGAVLFEGASSRASCEFSIK